jgi:hypothetical protein
LGDSAIGNPWPTADVFQSSSSAINGAMTQSPDPTMARRLNIAQSTMISGA